MSDPECGKNKVECMICGKKLIKSSKTWSTLRAHRNRHLGSEAPKDVHKPLSEIEIQIQFVSWLLIQLKRKYASGYKSVLRRRRATRKGAAGSTTKTSGATMKTSQENAKTILTSLNEPRVWLLTKTALRINLTWFFFSYCQSLWILISFALLNSNPNFHSINFKYTSSPLIIDYTVQNQEKEDRIC